MGTTDPAERRRIAVQAIGWSHAAERCEPGSPGWEQALADATAEVDADPLTDHVIAMADAIPPMDDWPPEVRREVRSILRKAAGG
jgi:hypothetical protein